MEYPIEAVVVVADLKADPLDIIRTIPGPWPDVQSAAEATLEGRWLLKRAPMQVSNIAEFRIVDVLLAQRQPLVSTASSEQPYAVAIHCG